MPNRVRFDGRSRRFYEVWYVIFNDSASGDGFWIRYTLLNPLDADDAAGGTLWFAFTDRRDRSRSVALKRAFAREQIQVVPGDARLGIAGATFEQGGLRGGFSSESHVVEWDLEYDPSPQAHYYFGPMLRRLTENRNSVTIPSPKAVFRGSVSIDGRPIEISHAVGHQAHHWGIAQSPRWIWGHCCAFEEDDEAVLELLSARGPAGITATFVNLHTADRSYRFDGAAALVRNRATSGLGYWRFEGVARDARVIADIRVDPEDVQGFVYTATDYRRSECWNTQVGDCLVRIYEPSESGVRLGRVLRCRGRAAAEVHDSELDRIPYREWSSTGRSRSAVG